MAVLVLLVISYIIGLVSTVKTLFFSPQDEGTHFSAMGNLDYNSIEEIIDPHMFIGGMSSDEYIRFIHKDRYGNDELEEASVLNLLEIVKDEGFEDKELITYKELAKWKQEQTQ